MRLSVTTVRNFVEPAIHWFRELADQCDLDKQLTVEFVHMLADKLSNAINRQVTPTQAWFVWQLVSEYSEWQRTQNQEQADIAFWYHVDPFGLTSDQRVALYMNLPRIKAQHALEHGLYNPTDYRGVYALVLMATGSKKSAHKAQVEALERYIDSKIKRGGG